MKYLGKIIDDKDLVTKEYVDAGLGGKANSSHTQTVSTISDLTATANELNVLDGITANTKELNYTDGVTSNIQSQLNSKQTLTNNLTAETALADGDYIPFYDTSATAHRKTLWSNIKSVFKTYFDTLYSAISHTHTVSSITDLTATASELNTLDGITATVTELNYTDGVTGNIQVQLNGKSPIASPTFTGTVTAPTLIATNYFRTPSLVGEGDTSTYYHRMDAGFAGHNYWAWYDYGGEYRFYANITGTLEGAKLIGAIKDGKGWVGNVEGNVTGNASTVNNHTVNKDVPSNAVFTDTVYTHPASHPPSIITQDSSNRFVTDAEKSTWNGKEPAITKNTAFNANFDTTAAHIKMNGKQSVGSLSTVARADHVHPTDTSRAASSHTHTVSNITDLTATASEINVLDGITASTTELNYTDGVTSNIQTQLNKKNSIIPLSATQPSSPSIGDYWYKIIT